MQAYGPILLYNPGSYFVLVRILLLILIVSISASEAFSGRVTSVIVDAETGEPLAMATIFNAKGNVIGFTDDKGCLPSLMDEQYPLTIRYMGYESAIIKKPTTQAIRLKAKSYQLPDIKIESTSNKVTHLLGYVREYSTMISCYDTITLFREKTVDFMIPNKNVKRYKGWLSPRILSTKSYYHFSDAYGLDSVSDYFREHFSWSDWVGIIDRLNIPRKVLEDIEITYTVAGEYSPAAIWKRNGENLHLDLDILADSINYKWIPRLSSFIRFNRQNPEFTKLYVRYDFSNVTGSTVYADNIGRISFNIETNGRGRKLFRVFGKDEPYKVNTYAEVYITDKEYLSVSAAKKWEKRHISSEETGIIAPSDAPELHASIKELIARVDDIDKEGIRINQEIDSRIGNQKTILAKPKNVFEKILRVIKH